MNSIPSLNPVCYHVRACGTGGSATVYATCQSRIPTKQENVYVYQPGFYGPKTEASREVLRNV